MGSLLIFGLWIYEADSEGNLQGRLTKAQKAHEEITLPTGLAEDLTKRFSGLTMSESTQVLTTTSLDLVSGSDPLWGLIQVLLEMNWVLFRLDFITQHQLFKRSIQTYFRFLLGS
jgi:hypothetical protein